MTQATQEIVAHSDSEEVASIPNEDPLPVTQSAQEPIAPNVYDNDTNILEERREASPVENSPDYFLRQPQNRKIRKNDNILFFSSEHDTWKRIKITSHGMGRNKSYYNFRFLGDYSESGAYFLPGQSWGLLTDEELNMDFSSVVIVGFGNPVPQDDGSYSPASLTPPSPRRKAYNSRIFRNSNTNFESPVGRNRLQTETQGRLLSSGEGFQDEQYADQEKITVTTSDEDLFGPLPRPRLPRPTTYEEVALDGVSDLSLVLPNTNEVIQMENLLPVFQDRPSKQSGRRGRE